jgi:ketosteroid isomerase-like protein
MSQENVEIVRREYDAIAAEDWAALEEMWHPDIEYSEFEVELDEILDVGDFVVAVERLTGRGLIGTAIGGSVHERLARVNNFKDGKIWRVREYRTVAEALEAVGLSE